MIGQSLRQTDHFVVGSQEVQHHFTSLQIYLFCLKNDRFTVPTFQSSIGNIEGIRYFCEDYSKSHQQQKIYQRYSAQKSVSTSTILTNAIFHQTHSKTLFSSTSTRILVVISKACKDFTQHILYNIIPA